MSFESEYSLVAEMIDLCSGSVLDRSIAVEAIRLLCKWYGGQLLSMPKSPEAETAKEIRGVLADAIGDSDADKIMESLTTFFGGSQLYIPMEARAFRDDIANEIYERYDGTMESMRELCREYRISYTQVYRLYHYAAEERTQKLFEF
ncbi:Mor transcription activator family protein [Sediminispirochaeta bajacaliforniensis]|uniref:Mor transcription activator family protein n=1 Tax=Sediminispirochaeta bajacaliforniensis TaxID=148 RepID=UPI000375744D|nr:Mor transcription activator family protein [Sediminispirochaeta bajacaliforniensis]